MKPILEVQNLSKRFTLKHESNPYLSLRDTLAGIFKTNKGTTKEAFYALHDINFTIQPGESIGIIGKNGAGKSTLLKILSKISPPTSGKIILRGRVASLLEVGTGFHPELSGRENIYLNGSILGMRKSEIKNRFDEIVDFSGVEKFLDMSLKHYSSGMQLRLAFSVAAFLEPEIMVIDEVLAVGDANFQRKCLQKMDDVSKSGRTIIFVSHQMGTIAQLCTRALLLQEGKLVYEGQTSDVIDVYLSSGENSNGRYIAESKFTAKKEMYFEEITTCFDSGKANDQFGFNDSIVLDLKINVKEHVNNCKIGIALLSKYEARVFTIVKDFDELCKTGSDSYSVSVKLPSHLLAPNNYSFTCALFVPFGKIIDIQENICRIRIFDTGTDLAIFEGIDYGNIIVNGEWQNNS